MCLQKTRPHGYRSIFKIWFSLRISLFCFVLFCFPMQLLYVCGMFPWQDVGGSAHGGGGAGRPGSPHSSRSAPQMLRALGVGRGADLSPFSLPDRPCHESEHVLPSSHRAEYFWRNRKPQSVLLMDTAGQPLVHRRGHWLTKHAHRPVTIAAFPDAAVKVENREPGEKAPSNSEMQSCA